MYHYMCFLFLTILHYVWVVVRSPSLSGVEEVSTPFLTLFQIKHFHLFRIWNLALIFPVLLFSSTYNSVVPYVHMGYLGKRSWRFIPFIKSVDVNLPRAWSPLYTLLYLNAQKHPCRLTAAGALIFHCPLLLLIGALSGQRFFSHLETPITNRFTIILHTERTILPINYSWWN